MKVFSLLAVLFFLAGCNTVDNSGEAKFTRFFCWGSPVNEETAEKYARAGVTDIVVYNLKQYELARKYGMRPYWKCFHPDGPRRQVMTPAEEKHHDYICGRDLDPKIPRAERREILDRRRCEKKHRYGGEPVAEIDTLATGIKCFLSDKDFVLSRKQLDAILDTAPAGAAGIYVDYIGYMNHRGCYCTECLRRYRNYLKERKLADTQENKDLFYRDQLADYYNRVVDYVKQKRPNFKVVVHIYPEFRPDPLYGNRTKADFCGQTVAWYFKWPEKQIEKYTGYVVKHAKDHHSGAEGIPFLGLNSNAKSSLGFKTPAEVEAELKTILAAGGRTLMVCTGRCIIEPGYFEIFRKYCGKE